MSAFFNGMLKYGVEVICCEIFQFEARGVIFFVITLYVYMFIGMYGI